MRCVPEMTRRWQEKSPLLAKSNTRSSCGRCVAKFAGFDSFADDLSNVVKVARETYMKDDKLVAAGESTDTGMIYSEPDTRCVAKNTGFGSSSLTRHLNTSMSYPCAAPGHRVVRGKMCTVFTSRLPAWTRLLEYWLKAQQSFHRFGSDCHRVEKNKQLFQQDFSSWPLLVFRFFLSLPTLFSRRPCHFLRHVL